MRPLCLCGESYCTNAHHRDTEVTEDAQRLKYDPAFHIVLRYKSAELSYNIRLFTTALKLNASEVCPGAGCFGIDGAEFAKLTPQNG